MFFVFSNICSALFNAQFLLLHLLLQKFLFMLASLKGSILTNKGPIFIETSGWNILENKLVYKPRPFKFLPALRHTYKMEIAFNQLQNSKPVENSTYFTFTGLTSFLYLCLLIEVVSQNLRMIDGRFKTILGIFFASYMNLFHITTVQIITLR